MQLLNSENVSSNAIAGFKADIHKRWKEKSEEQKRRELVRLLFIIMSPHFSVVESEKLVHKSCNKVIMLQKWRMGVFPTI